MLACPTYQAWMAPSKAHVTVACAQLDGMRKLPALKKFHVSHELMPCGCEKENCVTTNCCANVCANRSDVIMAT